MIKDASIYWNKFADFLLNNISTFIILWRRFQLEIEPFLSNFLSCPVQNIIINYVCVIYHAIIILEQKFQMTS